MSTIKTVAVQRKFLRELASLWPLAKGSLSQVRKPCIRPNCPACRQGRKHRSLLFSFTRNGKRYCRYVPPELADTLRQAILNGRHLEQRLFVLGEEMILRHRYARGRGQR